MNTLRTIQSLSKVGRVLSRIVFVFCIVGFCGCTVGLLFLGFGGEVFKLGSVTIHGFL